MAYQYMLNMNDQSYICLYIVSNFHKGNLSTYSIACKGGEKGGGSFYSPLKKTYSINASFNMENYKLVFLSLASVKGRGDTESKHAILFDSINVNVN